eukprot:840728-Rhodomonas_salina.2
MTGEASVAGSGLRYSNRHKDQAWCTEKAKERAGWRRKTPARGRRCDRMRGGCATARGRARCREAET